MKGEGGESLRVTRSDLSESGWKPSTLKPKTSTQTQSHPKIWPELEEFPKGEVQVESQGLSPYFTVYPDTSPNMDNIPPNDDLLRFCILDFLYFLIK